VVYEALNLAELWQAPLLFVLENNRIAQTTPVELALAGGIAERFEAFGIPTAEVDSSDVLEIWALAGECLAKLRANPGPQAVVIRTCRFGPHSKGDDTRPAQEIERMRSQRDPLEIHEDRLAADTRRALQNEVQAQIEDAFRQALADPYPETGDFAEHH